MKKSMVIFLLFVLGSLGSCSSSDDSNPPILVKKDLVLNANTTTAIANEKVSFNVVLDSQVVIDAEIFANDVKIGYEHVFTVAGVYKVIAKKANANDSNVFIITIMENSISEPEPGADSKYLGKWTPESVSVSLNGFPIPSGVLSYPHKMGCDKDTVELLASYDALFTSHNDNCEINQQQQPWAENGSLITMPILGIEIDGTVIEQTTNSMTIQTDIYKYKALVDQVFPEYSNLILPGMKANIKLVK